MRRSKYVNWPQIIKDYSGHFKLILVYDPQSRKAVSAQLDQFANANADSKDWICLPLPLTSILMIVEQLQILMTERFGMVSASVWVERKRQQKVQIQSGASHLENLSPEELESISHWFNRVIRDLMQRYL